MSATSSTQLLRHTAAFLSETLSQPDLRRHLSSSFLSRLPPNLLKPLNFASQTIENAISTTSPSIRSSSLRLAEKLLRHNSNHPFSSFLLSLVYYISQREREASVSLLDVFDNDPSLARSEIAPFLFQELFLIHFIPLMEWYNEQRTNILANLSNSNDDDNDNDYDDDRSIVSNGTTSLSKMSGGQASELKGLERHYEDLLDQNCRMFVGYFKDILQNGDGENNLIAPPVIILRKMSERKDDRGNEVKIKNVEFGSTNRRYNPIWTEGDGSVEFHNDRPKSLSKLPSLYPERVSVSVLTNQRSSKKWESSVYNKPSTYDNLSDCSTSDSDVEQEEKTKPMALFDSNQNKTHKQKQLLLSEDSSCRSPHPLMEDVDNPPGAGKHTPPKDFVCPITTHIFNDPATLETGQSKNGLTGGTQVVL